MLQSESKAENGMSASYYREMQLKDHKSSEKVKVVALDWQCAIKSIKAHYVDYLQENS